MIRQNAQIVNRQRPLQFPVNGAKSALHQRRPKYRRGFITYGTLFLAAVAFIVVMLLYHSLTAAPKGGTSETTTVISADHLAKLESITLKVEKQPTVLLFSDMMETSTRLSGLLELALLHVVDENEKAPENELDFAHDYTLLERAGELLSKNADIAYEKLKRMLKEISDVDVHLPPEHLPRMLFSWMTSTAYMYNAVLTEFYLLKDSTYEHAVSLIRSINIIGWASSTRQNIFNWSETSCQSFYEDPPEKWMSFCKRTCTSLTQSAIRQAASYEELIALYPRYGPFRLHYLILFALNEIPHAKSDAVLRMIHTQQKALNTYTNVDAFHSSWLDLLEIYELPSKQWSIEKIENAKRIVRELLKSCENLSAHHFVELNHSKTEVYWPNTFSKEIRPPLLTRVQLLNLLRKISPIMNMQEDAIILDNLEKCL